MLNEREFLTAVYASGDWLVRDMRSAETPAGEAETWSIKRNHHRGTLVVLYKSERNHSTSLFDSVEEIEKGRGPMDVPGDIIEQLNYAMEQEEPGLASR